MATKLPRKVYPDGHGPDDFECFGPIATQDGEFDSCMLVDLGCFNQSMKDSNKFYHSAMCKSKKNTKWHVYLQWGRTGSIGDFQFFICDSEQDARKTFVSQVRSKNDKRGEWVNKPGLGRILQAKEGDDCYLVRPLATRDSNSPGLPGARSVASSEVKVTKKVTAGTTKTKKQSIQDQYDAETISLMRDLNVATVQFTKASIQGGTIPTLNAIEEGRSVLIEAQKRIAKIGSDLDTQINDSDLRQLTFHLYSRIAKVKRVKAPESEWILSGNNIFSWQQDLDTFESALKTASIEIEEGESEIDPFGGMKIKMRHLTRGDTVGDFVRDWMPKATRNVHYNVGNLVILNAWEIEREGIRSKFDNFVNTVVESKTNVIERPGQQPKSRPDIKDAKKYDVSNTGLLFHGTRTTCVTGILREGLRFPKELVGVSTNGANFGPGHYWASDFKKSAGYTSLPGSYWAGGSGGIGNRKAFMFLADVSLGRAHVASKSYGYVAPPIGCNCVLAKAGVSGVQNDEWITFSKDQYQFRYLVEFSVK